MSIDFLTIDIQILSTIIEHANQRYMRQSRVNQKSTFNILRVLSAFKELSQQYGNKSDQIYNWIIFITKQYNPQTLGQWMSAVNELYTINKKSGIQQCTDRTLMTHPIVLNRTINEMNYSHVYEEESQLHHKSLAHLNINKQNVVTKKLGGRKEVQYMANESKIHYISFQPQQQNKQNCNISNNTYKSNCCRLQNLPTRTPGQLSLVRALPTSNGSPDTSTITKITQNTKQMGQISDQQIQTQEWINMKQRAKIFYKISLLIKSFFVFKVNYEVYENMYQIQNKLNKLYKNMQCERFFKNLQRVITSKKKLKYIENQFNLFYHKKLLKKSFTILNILLQLKIQKFPNKKTNIDQYKPYNYQFLLTIMFYPSQIQPIQSSNATPKSINEKKQYYLKVQDYQKIQLISQYFDSNIKSNKQQITHIFELYNKSRKILAFLTLKKNKNISSSLGLAVSSLVKKSCILDFIRISQQNTKNNSRVALMTVLKQRTSKQKCFNAFIQCHLSKKIYNKRQQLITSAHRQRILKTILVIWKYRCEEIILENQNYQRKLNQGIQILTTILYTKYLKQFFDQYAFQKKKQEQQQEIYRKQICKKIFQFLKIRRWEKKIFIQIQNKYHGDKIKAIFQLWKKNGKMLYSLSRITKNILKQTFNTIKQQSLLVSKINQLSKLLNLIHEDKAFKQIRFCTNLDKKVLNNKTSILQTQQKQHQSTTLIKMLKHNIAIQQKAKTTKELQQKSQALRQKKQKNKIKIQAVMKKQFIRHIQNQTILTSKSSTISINFIKYLGSIAKNGISRWRNQYHVVKIVNKIKRNKQIQFKIKSIAIFKQIYQVEQIKYGKAVNKHKKTVQLQILLIFNKAVQQTNQLIIQLQKVHIDQFRIYKKKRSQQTQKHYIKSYKTINKHPKTHKDYQKQD